LFVSYLKTNHLANHIIAINDDIANAKQPEKSILQSILAQAYWNIYSQNYYRIDSRTTIAGDEGIDVNVWSLARLQEETYKNFKASISEHLLLQNQDLKDLPDLIVGDESARYLRPTLYDLLAHRALSVFMESSRSLSYNPIETDRSKYIPPILLSLLEYHSEKKNTAAWADVEMLRLQYERYFVKSSRPDSIYFKGLEALLVKAKGTEIYADILYTMASLYRSPSFTVDQKNHLITAVGYLKEAIATFPGSDGGKKAVELLATINRKYLDVEAANINIPNVPVQVVFRTANLDSIYYSVYKLSFDHLYSPEINTLKSYKAFLKNSKPVLEGNFVVNYKQDYLKHTMGDQLPALPVGRYVMLVQNHPITDTTSADIVNHNVKFTVTNLAVASRPTKQEGYVFKVFNATTGAKIDNAIIDKSYNEPKSYESVESHDRSGYATISLGNDTTLSSFERSYHFAEEESAKVKFFLDRPIYRPGQKVFFKGLLFYTKEDKNVIFPKETVGVTFYDPNRQELDSLSLITNEFGTFQGSFEIPVGKRNGNFLIDTEYGEIRVIVEEYKRPTFEVLLDPLKDRLKLKESITVTGRVNAFSGYKISGAQVKYRVRPPDTKDIVGTTVTGADGTFKVKFYAETEEANIHAHFGFEVDVTDPSGETRSAGKDIRIFKQDLQFNFVNLFSNLTLKKGADTIAFATINSDHAPVKTRATASWHKLELPQRLTLLNKISIPNAQRLTKEAFLAIFPNRIYESAEFRENWKENPVGLKLESVESGSGGSFILQPATIEPGYYKVYFVAISENNDTARTSRTVRVYKNGPDKILHIDEWVLNENVQVKRGGNGLFRLAGLPRSIVHFEVLYKDSLVQKGMVSVSEQQTVLSIPIKANYEDRIAVQFMMVSNGVFYEKNIPVFIDDPSKKLEVKFLSFRDKLQPGQKESWKLKISSKAGEAKMVELLATLYDASLDKFASMDWNFYKRYKSYDQYSWRSTDNNRGAQGSLYFLSKIKPVPPPVLKVYPALNFRGYVFNGNINWGYAKYRDDAAQRILKQKDAARTKMLDALQKTNKFYGVITSASGESLSGVVVFLNGRQIGRTDAYGLYSFKGKKGDKLMFKYPGYANQNVIVGDDKRVDATVIAAINILDEVTIRGYVKRTREETTGSSFIVSGREVQDVPIANVEQLLQGKVAGINLENVPLRSSSQIRTDFNETAFFYPQLRTNSAGEITIEFTIPQSLTRFKLMGFAHTTDLSTLQFSRELITQKQLSISANAARFFREGDTVVFSARLSNLSGKKLKGNARIELRDALTGNVINILQNNSSATQKFLFNNNASQPVKWALVIPKGISAITYKITAESGKYEDGEEMTVPVLTNSTLVTETIQLNVRGNTSRTFELNKLLLSGSSTTARNHGLTLEFTSNPVWYAVQSLPYLMEYPYECAEQTMSRFYANSVATGIINSSPKVKAVFESWNQPGSDALASRLDRNEGLKSILLEETPWVRSSSGEQERKRRLSVLFDLKRMSSEMKRNFEKLQAMQNADGSFSWFSGMRSDRYITQHVVLSLAQLKKLNLVDEKAIPNASTMLNKAIIWLDNQLVEDYNRQYQGNFYTFLPLHYLYARSYGNQINDNAEFKKVVLESLDNLDKEWLKLSIYQQAMAAMVLNRNGRSKTALKIVASLKERATQDAEIGMYWEANKSGWWWYQSQIETQALLIEVFDEVAGDTKSVEEMKIWLLKNRQANDWKTTKATTAACYALLMRGYDLMGESAAPDIKLGGKTFKEMGIADPDRVAVM
ncbi:MAG: hypothetical protein EOO92_08775, partial [Pedobacter sp.]